MERILFEVMSLITLHLEFLFGIRIQQTLMAIITFKLANNQSTLYHITATKVFVNPNFSIILQELRFWDATDLPPLKRISSSRFLSEKVRKFALEVIFSFPCGFFLGVIGPLDFEEFDGTSPCDSVVFIQDSEWDIPVCEILVDIHRAVIYVFEHIGLVWYF